ncbi:MAG: hypothetical protein IOD12_00555, partial [Silvanigrellales bacterium]|nr:hypothetical protein [Silvanigrellales bacterium]
TPGLRSPKGNRHSPQGASLGVVGRPDFIPGRDSSEAWFEEFRTQATARSRNAAACFPGIERGAVRWSADVLGKDGRVTRNVFVPLTGLPELSSLQTKCLEDALAARTYTLRDFTRESARISLVLEF